MGITRKEGRNLFAFQTTESIGPRDMLRTSLGVMQEVAATIENLAPGSEGRVSWREFRNKLRVFELFEHPDSVLGLSSSNGLPLIEQIQLVRRLGPYSAVWVMEGLGHDYAETFWVRRAKPHGMFSTRKTAGLPANSLVPLHSGMGLSLAEHVLEEVTPKNSSSEIQRQLRHFVDLCDENSRSGYAPVAYESLGLVARNIFPRMVKTIDRELRQRDQQLLSYFWHGVGRAIYLAPTNFMPYAGALRCNFDSSLHEPPHELGRLNAMAGLAWALTLVNIQDPHVMESVLRQHGREVADTDAFADGVGSGIVIWYDSTRDPSLIEALTDYEPKSSDPSLAGLWVSQVRRPCQRALEHYEALKNNRRLGDIFRYQKRFWAG
jgi:hypothetical protein